MLCCFVLLERMRAYPINGYQYRIHIKQKAIFFIFFPEIKEAGQALPEGEPLGPVSDARQKHIAELEIQSTAECRITTRRKASPQSNPNPMNTKSSAESRRDLTEQKKKPNTLEFSFPSNRAA